MQKDEALQLLGLPSSATDAQVRSKLQQDRQLWGRRANTDPNPDMKRAASQRLGELEQAERVLCGASGGSGPAPTTPVRPRPEPSASVPGTGGPGMGTGSAGPTGRTHHTPPPSAAPPPGPTHAASPPPGPPPTAPSMPAGWTMDVYGRWLCTAHSIPNCAACSGYSVPLVRTVPTITPVAMVPSYVPAPAYVVGVTPKSKATAAVLAFFLGALGIHRFYLGHSGLGVAMLLISVLSVGFLAPFVWIWALIDMILILTDSVTDNHGRPLT